MAVKISARSGVRVAAAWWLLTSLDVAAAVGDVSAQIAQQRASVALLRTDVGFTAADLDMRPPGTIDAAAQLQVAQPVDETPETEEEEAERDAAQKVKDEKGDGEEETEGDQKIQDAAITGNESDNESDNEAISGIPGPRGPMGATAGGKKLKKIKASDVGVASYGFLYGSFGLPVLLSIALYWLIRRQILQIKDECEKISHEVHEKKVQDQEEADKAAAQAAAEEKQRVAEEKEVSRKAAEEEAIKAKLPPVGYVEEPPAAQPTESPTEPLLGDAAAGAPPVQDEPVAPVA